MCVVSIVRFGRSSADSGYTTSNQTTVPRVQTRSILLVFSFSAFLKVVEIFRWNVSVLFFVGVVLEFTVDDVDKTTRRKRNALAVMDEKGRY